MSEPLGANPGRPFPFRTWQPACVRCRLCDMTPSDRPTHRSDTGPSLALGCVPPPARPLSMPERISGLRAMHTPRSSNRPPSAIVDRHRCHRVRCVDVPHAKGPHLARSRGKFYPALSYARERDAGAIPLRSRAWASVGASRARRRMRSQKRPHLLVACMGFRGPLREVVERQFYACTFPSRAKPASRCAPLLLWISRRADKDINEAAFASIRAFFRGGHAIVRERRV
ncbi:hypothetical protein PYCCODRAFT_369028 [Trametes coccinea BRFM310]|uniref:Uncharacterized protein n=1 Tax=Trametes coccinea (strain BRFM310) TaxID=1353009 RepID=A0A1Y2J6T2_TRAC3|nr:hypothetical protein PYCCODRAFT_369028 [Trametes coccinea BRFM310]